MFWDVVGGLALLLFISIASSYNTIPLKNIDMWAADTLQGSLFTDVTAGASLGVACVIAAAYMYKKVIH